jgi:hypothetical protein
MYRQGWDTGGNWDADWERVRKMDPEGVEKVGVLFRSFLFSSLLMSGYDLVGRYKGV